MKNTSPLPPRKLEMYCACVSLGACTCLYIRYVYLHSSHVTLSSLIIFNFSVMHPHTFGPHTLMSSLHFLHRYYRDVDGAVLVYDMTNRKSFEKVDMWLKELQEQVDSKIVIMLFGNKCDLPRPQLCPQTRLRLMLRRTP